MDDEESQTRCCSRSGVLYGDVKYWIAFFFIVLLTFLVCTENADIIISGLEYLEDLELQWQIVLFVALFFLVSLPFAWGYIILNVGAGFLYGFWQGLCLVSLSTAVGISGAHVLNRYCLRTCLQRTVAKNGQLSSMVKVLDGKHAFKLIALSRLTPFPFGLMNALFAVSDVTYLDYVTASVLGLLPTQALNAYVGTTLKNIHELETTDEIQYVSLALQLLVSAILLYIVFKLAQQNLDSELSIAEHEIQTSDAEPLAETYQAGGSSESIAIVPKNEGQ